MAQLAIKGHSTRGNEVIKILEMLGGRNPHNYTADCDSLCFYIGKGTNIIYYDWVNNCYEDEDVIVFTIEEFLEKYPYKVGDKVGIPDFESEVRIDDMEWNGYEVLYNVFSDESEWFSAEELNRYNSTYKEETTKETMEVSEEFFNKYCKKCGSQRCTAEGEWLEGCEYYKKETMEETIKIDIPNGYEFAGVDDDNQQVVFTKIQTQYPKTYEECCDVLGLNNAEIKVLIHNIEHGEAELYRKFIELKRCREAYWKIAGEQMGLGKPWEPDTCQVVHSIARYANEVVRHNDTYGGLFILEFPTKEMRDAFCENFKELIEQCKELL